MSISFNEVPANIRVPFLYAEFDNSNAVQGPALQLYRALLIGNKLAAGTDAELTPKLVTSKEQADDLYGQGSVLSQMAAKFLENNRFVELTCVAIDDDGAAVKAAGSFQLAGVPTESGIINLWIGGKFVSVAVSTASTPTTLVAALQAAIALDADLPVDAAVNGVDDTILDLTAKNGGEFGNDIGIRHSYADGQKLPAGITSTITVMASGAGNPDVAQVFTVLGDTQYILMSTPYLDSVNMVKMETELLDRFGPIKQNDGYAIYAKRDTLNNLSVLGNSRNSQFTSVMISESINLPWEVSAGVLAEVAGAGQADPARPFQTLGISGLLPVPEDERFTLEERNTLLFNGLASQLVDDGGIIRIERISTTYKTNSVGAVDTSYLDLNTLLTLSFIRFDFRTLFLVKYPRHKLANDGTRFAAGQAVITPKIGKAEAIAKFRQWEELALVENIDQFKEDLIVERNAIDPNRLDFLLPPDLVNQMRVFGVKIGFLL